MILLICFPLHFDLMHRFPALGSGEIIDWVWRGSHFAVVPVPSEVGVVVVEISEVFELLGCGTVNLLHEEPCRYLGAGGHRHRPFKLLKVKRKFYGAQSNLDMPNTPYRQSPRN